ncbi:MAG TPA: response regulator [Rhodopseudomonas sp.]|uniref:response regulator n=1 Tax=Rhodopseudomonas sp. TaxID=1078 RepID=UPI002EDB59EE
MTMLDTMQAAPKMLIADDDPWLVRVLAERCTRMGFVVETASNGLQVLMKARLGKPDILLIDVNMPEVDGLSVCAQLLDPDRDPLHVVVVTGSRDPETVERCESFGAFYTRKGSAFWNELEGALSEVYPALESRIKHSGDLHAPAEVRQRPCVLLVDDDANVRDFLTSRLRKCGIDVLYAADATQGYRMACRQQPTVIVSDFAMPNGDAQYLLTKLRTTTSTGEIPVIVLSGRDLNEVTRQTLRREICGHRGANQILKKSMDTSELFDTLQQYCGFAH